MLTPTPEAKNRITEVTMQSIVGRIFSTSDSLYSSLWYQSLAPKEEVKLLSLLLNAKCSGSSSICS